MKTSSHMLFSAEKKLLLAFMSLLMLCGCSINLAPDYDQNIVDGMIGAQSQTYQLLAQLEGGTPAADYVKHEEKYNEIIGRLESVEMVINARPMPDNKKLKKIVDNLNTKINTKYPSLGANAFPANLDKAPSAIAMANIVKTIKQMKAEDKVQGIGSVTYAAYKQIIVLYFDQALTYEQFLKQ